MIKRSYFKNKKNHLTIKIRKTLKVVLRYFKEIKIKIVVKKL